MLSPNLLRLRNTELYAGAGASIGTSGRQYLVDSIVAADGPTLDLRPLREYTGTTFVAPNGGEIEFPPDLDLEVCLGLRRLPLAEPRSVRST